MTCYRDTGEFGIYGPPSAVGPDVVVAQSEEAALSEFGAKFQKQFGVHVTSARLLTEWQQHAIAEVEFEEVVQS